MIFQWCNIFQLFSLNKIVDLQQRLLGKKKLSAASSMRLKRKNYTIHFYNIQ